MISQDFQKQATGYGLTTAQILYRCPDHPWLLQTYVWQAYDLCPEFPELQGFLEFWQKSLEGVLHSVTVAFSPYQTGRDQTGGRAVPAALISDPASLAAASAPDGYISLAYPPPGKSSLCNQPPQGKGRHMNQVGLRRPMFLAGGCAYLAGISSAVVQKSVISDCLHRPLLQSRMSRIGS
jgi:uncharacterized protein Usg